MALDLRANTAVDVLIGPFVDSTDGNTTEDGLTLSQADIKLSKNGQALTQKNDVTAAAFDDDGYYNCELDATDTNTEGQLVLIVHESGALPVRHEYNVMAEAAWDSLYVAKDDGFMDVNIKTLGRTDSQETEANNLESACSNYSVTRGLTGTAVPAVAAEAAGGLFTRGSGAGQINQDNNGEIDVDLQRIFGTILSEGGAGRLAAAFIKLFDVVTPVLLASDVMRGTDGANTTVPDAAGVAATPAEVATALTDIKLDHLINSAAAEDEVADNSIIARLAATEGDWSEFNDENHSLEAIRVRGDAAWVTAAGFALASVVGALNNVAADGEVTDADTLMQYLKQLINILIGTPGIGAFPAEAAPANAVSLAEVIRAIHADTSSTLDALIKDVPTVAEFEARSIVAADYTVVGDLGTVQSGDSFAIVNGAHGLVSIQDDVDEILIDTGTTLDVLIKDVPTVAEFEARSIVAADYVVVGDTLARVTLVDTVTTNTDLVTAAAVKTAMEADGGDLSSIMEALVNKLLITEANGNAEIFNDAGASQGTVAAAFTSVAGVTQRKRMVI